MIKLSVSLFALSLTASPLHAQDKAVDYDILITGAAVYDGSGGPARLVNVAIKGDMIVSLNPAPSASATTRLDAKGLALSPGFIDLHSHADYGIEQLPLVDNMVQQGVTTILGGNCGFSPVTIGDLLSHLDHRKIGPNVALLIGHNDVRKAVMQSQNRPATEAELTAMKALIANAMKGGAYGLSTGLKYVPGSYASTSEVVELATVSAQYGGIYTSHMREEGQGMLKAVEETINIGVKAKLPVHISHHKAVGTVSWGNSKQSLALIDKARAGGLDVTLDQYPYTASSTRLTVIFPAWAQEGGQEKLLERMKNPETRAKIKADIIHAVRTDRGGDDPARIQIANFPADPSLNGLTFAQVLTAQNRALTIENTAELAMELQAKGGLQGIYHAMDEQDVKRIMQHPMTSIATDGGVIKWGEGNPHPRSYGTFPRVLGKYVREEAILDLTDAIRKMTSLPAARMGLKDRGLIKVGYKADLVLFDPKTVKDTATFTAPHHYAVGINTVIINGKIAKNPKGLTGIGSGKALRHSGTR